MNTPFIYKSIRLRWLCLPAIMYLVFVVYGSLVPLTFRALEFGEAIERFNQIRYLNLGITSRADWVANGLLMIPLTFLLTGSFWGNSRKLNFIVAVLVIFFCVFLSIAIEFTQLYFPPRTVSQNDIYAEGIGGVIGVITWLLTGTLYLNYIKHLNTAFGTRSVSKTILLAYLAILYGYSLLPLDLTISPVEIYHKWMDGKVVLIPFSAFPNTPAEFIYEALTDIFIWLPVSMLLILSGQKQTKNAIFWVVSVAGILEFLQLFVFSRVSDLTDIFTALLGAAIGAILAGCIYRQTHNVRTQTHNTSVHQVTIGLALFLLWAVFLLLIFWYPYNFNFEGSFLRQRVEGFSSVPFVTYYYGSEFHAITELLRRVCFFTPLGAALFLGKPLSLSKNISRIYTALAMISIMGVATLIELGQTALPNKFPNNTDIALQFLGGILGFLVTDFVYKRIPKKIKYNRPSHTQPSAFRNHNQHIQSPNVNEVDFSTPTFIALFLGLLTISGLMAFVFNQNSIPYNVRELVSGNYTWLRILGFVFTGYWVFGLPLSILIKQESRKDSGKILTLPHKTTPRNLGFLIIFHLLSTWMLVRSIFPIESIHDIIGSPIFHNYPELEYIIRFLAFFIVISAIIWYSSLLLISQFSLAEARKLQFLFLFLFLLISIATAYLIVIEHAGTDNIIELLNRRGHSASIFFLALYFLLLIYSGLAFSFIRQFKGRSLLLHIIIIVISAPLGYWIIQQGLESLILKYGKVFSAMQFLLSSNRENYIQPHELFGRFCIAHYSIILFIGAIQTHNWIHLIGKANLKKSIY